MTRNRGRNRSLFAAVACALLLAATPAAAETSWAHQAVDWIKSWISGGKSTKPPAPAPAPGDRSLPGPDLFPDLPKVGFAAPSSRVREGKAAVLRVVRSGGSGETVRVGYSVEGRDAAPESDFKAAGGVIVMAPGVMEQIITVETVDDGTYEKNETFVVRLHPPGDGLANAQIDEVRSMITVTIEDDDPKPAPPPPPGRMLAEPERLSFGEILQGRERLLEMSLTNTGGRVVRVERARVAGPGAGTFSVDFDECRGREWKPRAACGIGVRFSPLDPGRFAAELRVELLGEGGRIETVAVALDGAARKPAVVEDPMGARIAALRAQRRARGGAVVSTEVPAEPPKAKTLWATRDPDYAEIGIGRSYFSLPVERSRIITNDRHIPCVLEDTVNSQIEGFVRCVVEQNVYGSDGRLVLIPGGARVVGKYESLAKNGDTRLNITWQRFILPNGASIAVDEGFQSADASGRTGLPGHIDNRMWERYGGAILLTSLSVGATALVPTDNDQLAAAAETLANNLGDITTQVLEENLDLRPVMTIPAGTRLTIMPLVDLWLPTPDRLEAKPAG